MKIRFFKRICLIILVIAFPSILEAQRLNFGFTYNFIGLYPTHFSRSLFFSETSYKAYYIKKMQCPWGMQSNMALNVAIDYNRFIINGSLGLNSYLVSGTKYSYTYPLGENVDRTYYSRIQHSQTDFSGSIGYILSSRHFMRPFVEIGFGRWQKPTYREDIATEKSFKSYWSNRTELKDYAGLDKAANYLLLGYGYRGDMFAIAGRYKIRLGRHEVFYSDLGIGMTVLTRFSKLRKHYIYQPEE
jgi:hypothetical protein